MCLANSIEAYSPQLAARLNINHTQLNIVALAANGAQTLLYLPAANVEAYNTVGVYSSGPFWGRIVDSRGPRIPLSFAFVFLFFGYTGIRHFYNVGVENGATVSSLSLALLIACSFMTGTGGNAGFTGAINSTAKSFPDKAVRPCVVSCETASSLVRSAQRRLGLCSRASASLHSSSLHLHTFCFRGTHHRSCSCCLWALR